VLFNFISVLFNFYLKVIVVTVIIVVIVIVTKEYNSEENKSHR